MQLQSQSRIKDQQTFLWRKKPNTHNQKLTPNQNNQKPHKSYHQQALRVKLTVLTLYGTKKPQKTKPKQKQKEKASFK